MICFSGFADTNKQYNLAYKAKLEQMALKLGWNIVTNGKPEFTITHVVVPPRLRTLKSLKAALAGKWVVTPDWLEACAKAERHVPESEYECCLSCLQFVHFTNLFIVFRSYGRRSTAQPLVNKRVYFTAGCTALKAYNKDNFQDLIVTVRWFV